MSRKLSRAAIRWIGITGIACCAGIALLSLQRFNESPSAKPLAMNGENHGANTTQDAKVTGLAMLAKTHDTVMVVGGSIARGSLDPHKNSYIRRAFTALSKDTHTLYSYKDQTLIGGTAASRKAKNPQEFEGWLKADKPQVVVLAWGIMSDLYDKTPKAEFESAIHTEIQEALQAHAVVFVITPPVVKALATNRHDAGVTYMQEEFDVAKSFHSQSVFTFDVFSQMESYMKAHHQSYQMYYGDNWHPNGLGHQVAGQLLYRDFAQTFGTKD